MHDGISILGEIGPHVVGDLIKVLVRSPERLACFDIFDHGLLGFYPAECVTMACVEASFLPIALETNGIRIDRV